MTPGDVYDPLTWPSTLLAGDLVVRVTYDGLPVAKGRARYKAHGKGMYTPLSTREYETKIGWLIRKALGPVAPDAESRFGLRCVFYRPNRLRIDCDNLIKAISDAATGLVWKDDSQVLEVIGRLFLAAERPHVEFAIYRVPDTAARPKCPTCAKRFVTYPSIGSKYCSVECFNQTRRVTRNCRQCEKTFTLPQSSAKATSRFCSRSCASTFHGQVRVARTALNRVCQDCGRPVSRREYTRCRGCSMKHRSDPTSNYWKVRHAAKPTPDMETAG